jgi:transposase
MAAHKPLMFSPDVLDTLADERYTHPDPKVQRRFEVLWLLNHGETQQRAGQLAGVSGATVERIVACYRRDGLAGVRTLKWKRPVSELESHRECLEESFRQNPPHTVAEACQRIEELTGLKRGPTQVRQFLKRLSA